MPDYSYLQALTTAELADLRTQVESDITAAQIAVAVAEEQVSIDTTDQASAQSSYDAAVIGANIPPNVSGETAVDNGGAYAVSEYIAIDIPVNLIATTGNGDDGIGIVQDWSIPLDIPFYFDIQIHVSGEKVSETANLIASDFNGGIPESGGSLLENEVGIIDPDLFDPNTERNPDKFFVVTTDAPPPVQTFAVSVFAKAPNQIFDIEVGPAVPDQVFGVQAITVYDVGAYEPPFIFKVFATPPDQTFAVRTSAVPADTTFTVTRGPNPPDTTFEVFPVTAFSVTASWAPPDQIFYVELGPDPAPNPDVLFNVSVGGPDAPPIPTPDTTFAVSVYATAPNQVFKTKVITAFDVVARPAPFLVTVGPEIPDQTFVVEALAQPFDQQFSVTVGPDIPDQTFTVTSVETFAVTAYEAPKTYQVQENSTPSYVVSGEGLSFATQPALGLYVGQQLNLVLNVPSNPLWIWDLPGVTGQGPDPATFGATITNNGGTSGVLQAVFYQPGTYYYNSETSATTYGQIDVFGTQPGIPDQTFAVNVFAEPASQEFSVTVGPGAVDQTFTVKTGDVYDVTVGPETPDQTFTVIAYAENPDSTFFVTVDHLPLAYTVTNNGTADYQFTGEGLTNALDPTINMSVGQSLELAMQAAGHPLWIGSANTTGTGVASATWADELANNGIDTGGVIRVVFNTPGTYHYNCQFHSSMHGTIVVT